MPVPELVTAARHALEAAWGVPVELGEPEPLWEREHVLRVAVRSPDDHERSVVVKSPRPGDDEAAAFAVEAAALRTVGSGNAPVSARLLAWSPDPPVVVMEDVGGGPSLADLLLGHDGDAATAALTTYAEGLADLHLAAMANVDTFDALVREAGQDPMRSSFGSFSKRRALWEQHLVAYRIDGRRAQADLDSIEHTLTQPGDFRGVVHGDPCPDNVRFVEGRMRVFDFEWASIGHVLLDAVYLSVPFPTCWCVGSLPMELVAEAEDSYRDHLGIDDARWARERRLVWAAWIVATTSTLLRRVNEGDDRLWGTTSHRTRINGRLVRFVEDAEGSDPVPELTAVVARLHDALVARWPEAEGELPAYPALARPGERVAATPEWWFAGA